MRVLQINSVCGVGSTGRIAAGLHASLAEHGDAGFLAYGRGEGRGCGEAIRIGGPADVYGHVALTRLLDRHGFGSRRATRRFLRQAEALSPDLVHLHNLHGYYLHVGELFRWLKESGLPVVWTLHDCWAFTGHCAYFDYAGCEKWRTGCGSCPQKAAYPSSLLADRSARNYAEKRALFTLPEAMTVVAPSEWLAGLAGESFLGKYPVRVIPNGVDRTVFRPTPDAGLRERVGISPRAFLLLGVAGVWEERKGLPYLLALRQELGEDCRLVVVGVDERQKAALPREAVGLSRTESAAELAALYSAADVLVNPTLEDNFPTVNLEALACGTPVVTFRTGGSPESLDESTGRVVDKGDAAGLAAAVREIRRLGKAHFTEACLKRAEERYDQRLVYDAYSALYREILKGKEDAGDE